MALTAKQIENAKAKDGKRVVLSDGAGLYLRVSPAGSKTWYFRGQVDGKRVDLDLGVLEALPAPEARKRAAALRAQVKSGIPLVKKGELAQTRRAAEAHDAEKARRIFRTLAEEYIETHSAGWKNAKHAAQWAATLETYAYPVIGDLPVEEITLDHILKILTPIWSKKPETASRVRGRLELVLGVAKARRWIAENPALWRGNLKVLLPSPASVKSVVNRPALPWKQIPAFVKALRQMEGLGARALELVILTATRSNEVRGAAWKEFDLEEKSWTIPSVRMKGKRGKARAHRIPLSAPAMTLLKSLPRFAGTDLLFPSSTTQSPISDMTLLAVLRRMNRGEDGARWVDMHDRPIVVHGFRSSFRDWAAEATTYSGELAEMALAHVVSNAVEAAYRRGDLFDKRRQLMEDWGAWCLHSRKTP